MNAQDTATILAAAAAVAATAFAVLYPVRTRGTFTKVERGHGWLIWGLGTVIALFLDVALSARLFGRYPGYVAVALTLYAVLVPLTWWLLVSMLHATARRSRNRKKD